MKIIFNRKIQKTNKQMMKEIIKIKIPKQKILQKIMIKDKLPKIIQVQKVKFINLFKIDSNLFCNPKNW